MSDLEGLLQARLAELLNQTPDLATRIAEVLAYHRCRQMNPKADDPITGYHTFSADQRDFLRGLHADTVADLMPLITEAKAEGLREAADSLEAHADKNEREVVRTAWGTRANVKGIYWAVHRVRITARWLRVRATNLAVR